ncbi:diaminopimelate decarboxylase [Candidatus Chloroploca sp. M-50]|uniref:Diaminopimelate decarboxylase n=1 Tax=Candidatus Chloroploca mongolica TaxID=2528176 RepID=A0ABS4D4X9_9CHLR|nr:diaminopimelate decarboxylase [Candidatus Chloroploca mongolica]MBP1464488.1 diaminopimelate decarboxylase [Candidatus Chloroploca mongolica]
MDVWPETVAVRDGHLAVGGCDLVALAEQHGTPLYVFDEVTLRGAMRTYRAAFAAAYPAQHRVHYASKALLNTALAQIVAEEGLGLDVVSAAELRVAQRAGVPMEHVHLHGNAKSALELERALAWNVGAIVVDNLDELAHLCALTAHRPQPQGVLLRLAPDIAAQTHAHIATGSSDAKFGLPLAALDAAVTQLLAAPGLHLLGLHAHIGSQLFRLDQLQATVQVLLEAAVYVRDQYGYTVTELSPGGGLGVPYTTEQPPTDICGYATMLAATLTDACTRANFPLPRLTIEPGRSIIARAGVALYRVIGRKYAPDGRLLYLHVDGGMADNLRPALYGARYSALLANRAAEPADTVVAVAGRYCESGDILLRDIALPSGASGDVLAVATAGAYTLSMASTYNLVPRPAVLLLAGGSARLIQRRETEEELLARDIVL